MSKNEKKGLELDASQAKSANYSDDLSLNYCDFRLSNLAKKIKAECLKFKKDYRFLNT